MHNSKTQEVKLMTVYLGENIKKLRQEKGITQEVLADFLGVTFQSVSRWERGESYPDITMLPDIADFFKVSVDSLLGVNRAKNEEEITALLEEYDRLRNEWENQERKREILTVLQEKYPVDFRVQLKYMEYMVSYEFKKLSENATKIRSIYENIQKNCTVDSIRIRAKNHYISFLAGLAADKNSGVTFEDYEKIIGELPRMRDCQETYCFLYEYNHKNSEAVQATIEELILLLQDFLSGWYLRSEKFSVDYQIDILHKTADFFNYIYDDGNFGSMWTVVINCCYGLLGLHYYKKGDNENALANLRKSAELAVKFDNLERFTTLHSTLFEGRVFDKHTLGSDLVMKTKLKELFTVHYGFSDEFKSSTEFREIIALLE